MEMGCAECGCVVNRGVIVGACDRYPECCCQDLSLKENGGNPQGE